MTDYEGAKCGEIRPLLKEIDEGFEVEFNFVSEKYVITHNTRLFQSVPYGEFDRALLEDIRHTFWLNKQDRIFDYVDATNEKRDLSEDKRLSEYSRCIAEDLRRPLINNYYYNS